MKWRKEIIYRFMGEVMRLKEVCASDKDVQVI